MNPARFGSPYPPNPSSGSHLQCVGSLRWIFHTPEIRGRKFQVLKLTGTIGHYRTSFEAIQALVRFRSVAL